VKRKRKKIMNSSSVKEVQIHFFRGVEMKWRKRAHDRKQNRNDKSNLTKKQNTKI
jgi:hypothetical protein